MSERQDGWADKWLEARRGEERLGRIPMGGDGKAALWWKAFKLLSSSAWGLELYKSKMSRRHWSCSALLNETQTWRRSWGRYRRPSGPASTLTSFCTVTRPGEDQWQLSRPRLRSLFNCDKLQMAALLGAVLLTSSTGRISTWIPEGLKTQEKVIWSKGCSCFLPLSYYEIIKDKCNWSYQSRLRDRLR